jgi:hypothetical protein
MGRGVAGQDFVSEEYSLAVDFGRGFFGFSASRRIPGRIQSGSDYWRLRRQLQQKDFDWKFLRLPWEASTEGVTLGFGYALPLIPSANIEVDVFKLAGEIFDDIVNDFAIKPVPRR